MWFCMGLGLQWYMPIVKYILIFIIGSALGISINFSYSFQDSSISFAYAPLASFVIGVCVSFIKNISKSWKIGLLGFPFAMLCIYGMIVNPNWTFPALFIYVFFSILLGIYGISSLNKFRKTIIVLWLFWFAGIYIVAYQIIPRYDTYQRTKYVFEKLKDSSSALLNPSGDIVHLFDFKGKILMLDFFNIQCVPCMKQFLLNQMLDSAYSKESKFIIIAINTGQADSYDQFKEFVKKTKYSLSFLYDGGSNLSKSLNIKGVPQCILIDKQGNVRMIHSGFSKVESPYYVDNMKNEINKLLQE